MSRGRFSKILVVCAVWCLFFASSSSGQAQIFDIPARSALLMDAATGQVLFEKNADEPMEPASLVKIMTMLVVMDAVKAGRVSLEDEVRTSRRASQMGGSQVYLAEGEVHSLEKMLKAVAIASGNDASLAVAEFLAGTEAAFVSMMNQKARELSMVNSVFHNPEGLPAAAGEEPSLITARDIAKASRELIVEHPTVLNWTSTVTEVFRDSPLFILYNTNGLVGKYDGLDGLKTGYTSSAGYNLVATAKRGDIRLISVVLGTASVTEREEQSRALLDHGFNRFEPVLVGEGIVGEVKLASGSPERFHAAVREPVRILKPRGVGVEISGVLEIRPGLQAPLAAGDEIGSFVVRMDGEEVLRVPAVAAVDVERAGFFVRMWRSTRDFVLGLFGS